MRLLDFFRSKRNQHSASIAKERLKVIVSHERAKKHDPDFLKKLHAEIMEVIKKHVNIDSNKVNVNIDQDSDCSVLELNITLNDEKITFCCR